MSYVACQWVISLDAMTQPQLTFVKPGLVKGTVFDSLHIYLIGLACAVFFSLETPRRFQSELCVLSIRLATALINSSDFGRSSE